MVEQWIENPRVISSTLILGTIHFPSPKDNRGSHLLQQFPLDALGAIQGSGVSIAVQSDVRATSNLWHPAAVTPPSHLTSQYPCV